MDRRGNHAVELALILPIFLALLTGVFDYGWLMLHRQLAADAAQTGARAGAMAGEEEDADMVAAAAAAQRWSALKTYISIPMPWELGASCRTRSCAMAFTAARSRPR